MTVSFPLLRKPGVPASPLAGSGHALRLQRVHGGGDITNPHGAGSWGRRLDACEHDSLH